MRRRISLFLAAMLAGTTLMLLAPAQPASAWLVCGPTANVVVTPGLLYPVLLGIGPGAPGKDHVVDILIGTANTTHTFTATFATPCVHTSDDIPPRTVFPVPAGILKGYCGHSSGTGTIAGEPFSYISAGTILVLTGHVVGVASAIPPPIITGSCLHVATPLGQPTFALPGGATTFILTGVAVAPNCSNALPATNTLLRVIDTDTLITAAGMSLIGVHVHLGVHFWTTAQCTTPGSPLLP